MHFRIFRSNNASSNLISLHSIYTISLFVTNAQVITFPPSCIVLNTCYAAIFLIVPLPLLYCALPSLGTSHFDFSSINMGGGIDEEILVNPSDRHYCSDCIVYIAVYGYRVLTQVAALMLCLHSTHSTPTITHPIKNVSHSPSKNISHSAS